MKPSRMIVYLAAAAVMVPGARLAAAPVEIANAVYSVITAGEYAMCKEQLN